MGSRLSSSESESSSNFDIRIRFYTLKDMGFSEERAKKALNKTGWSGVESAMEWLLNHPEGEGDEDEDDDEMEVEPEIPKVPLTAEEKEQKIKEIEEGKNMSKLRNDVNDQEIRKIAEERKREKQQTADAKRRVLEAIEADKRSRQMERDAAKGIVTAPSPTVPAQETPAPPKRNYDETKIQVRLHDGKKLEQTFKSKEPLSAVRVFVQLQNPGLNPIKLMTTFPRKVFSEEDYEKPLEVLGLCPSAVIILSK